MEDPPLDARSTDPVPGLEAERDPTHALACAVLFACERSEDEWEVDDLVAAWVDEIPRSEPSPVTTVAAGRRRAA